MSSRSRILLSRCPDGFSHGGLSGTTTLSNAQKVDKENKLIKENKKLEININTSCPVSTELNMAKRKNKINLYGKIMGIRKIEIDNQIIEYQLNMKNIKKC